VSATIHNIADARIARNPHLEVWLTTAEIADYLGFSTKWVTRRVSEGMPHARMGARLRFKISQVEPWLMNHA
jgi:excisionase family DNA binding protein